MTPEFFSSLKTPVDFYIIRHGQSEGNAGKVLQGRGEYPLSAAGRDQAALRGRSIKETLPESELKKTLLFSSPLGRARETAEIISREAGLAEPVCLDELIEMDLGIWSGKVWDEVKNDDPSLWDAFMAKSWDAIPKAESSAVLYERALAAWAVLRDTAVEKGARSVIVVTHGGLLQWLLKSSVRCRTWFPLFPISNCGLSKFCAEPKKLGVYMCWEVIDSPIPSQPLESRGFPS